MAGLVPAIPITKARQCPPKRDARLSEMPATSAGMTRRQVFRGAAQYGALTSAQILSPLRLRYSLRWPRRSSLAKRFALAFEPYSWVTLPPFLMLDGFVSLPR